MRWVPCVFLRAALPSPNDMISCPSLCQLTKSGLATEISFLCYSLGIWTSSLFLPMPALTSCLKKVPPTLTQRLYHGGGLPFCQEPRLSLCSSTLLTGPTPGTRFVSSDRHVRPLGRGGEGSSCQRHRKERVGTKLVP